VSGQAKIEAVEGAPEPKGGPSPKSEDREGKLLRRFVKYIARRGGVTVRAGARKLRRGMTEASTTFNK